MYRRFFASLLALSLLLFAPAASGQTLLRWKLTPGQKLSVVCTQQTEVETSINNKPERATLEMMMALAWEVKSVDEQGLATIEQSFTRLAITTKAPLTEPVTFDSDAKTKPSKAAQEIAAQVLPLLGAKFQVVLDPRGAIQSVTVSDDGKQALDGLPENSQLKSLLTPEGLKQLLRATGGGLPEKEVAAGETWNEEQAIHTPSGELKQTTEFTATGATDEKMPALFAIKVKSQGVLTPVAGAKVKLDLKEQTTTGQIVFDTAAGRVHAATSTLTSRSVRAFRGNDIYVKIVGQTELKFK